MTGFAQSAVWTRPVRPLLRHILPSAVAAALAMLAWAAFAAERTNLPMWLRFTAALLLIAGPGAAAVSLVATRLSPTLRVALALGFGLGLTPILAHALAFAGLLDLYPFVAVGSAGASLAYWLTLRPASASRQPLTARLAPLAVVVFAFSVGAVAFAHRMTTTGRTVTINGEYDAYDLAYYAAIAAEASHTVPPASPFYAGRILNHSFYPHLALAVVHRFADIPILDLYFRHAWPVFLALAALLCFVLVQELASTATGLIAAALLVVGSDLSFLVPWFWHPAGWDDVVWSANFLSPGGETLLFNNWTPALALVLSGLFALARAEREAPRRWIALAAICFAAAILFKPFAFALVTFGIGAAWLTSLRRGSGHHQRVLFGAGALTAALGLPFIARIILLFGDSQVTFQAAPLSLPLRMLGRIGLDTWLAPFASRLTDDPLAQLILIGIAGTPLFLIGGLGFRLAGVPGLWRALRRPGDERPIVRVMAWAIVGAVAIPFFVTSVPYHETMQVHQFALFLLPIFVARAIVRDGRPWRTAAATIGLLAIAVPSTAHFVARKWTDESRPFATIGPAERAIASALRRGDPETTLVLHARPTEATFVGILASRRSVLAWGRYVRDSGARRREVDRFFQSRDGDPSEALATLDRYRPTHVIEDRTRDRIHPAVRARLHVIFQNPQVALYGVNPNPVP